MEERKHFLHLSHRPHAAGDFPVYAKGMQQAGGVHCGHQIFKKRLSHAHFSSLPGKSKIAGPAYSDAEPACRQAHRQGPHKFSKQVSWLAARHVLRLLTCETCNGDLQPAPRLQ